MGGGSEGEEGFYHPPLPVLSSSASSTKRINSHRKQFDNRYVVGNSVIPRKLRSAMNKRKCESVFPPLPNAKKPQHATNGIDDCLNLKKPSQNMLGDASNQSAGGATSDPITKDEEEVAETLYALSKMVPNIKLVKRRVRRRTSEAKSSFQGTKDNYRIAPKDGKKKSLRSQYPLSISSSVGGSPRENTKGNPSTNSTVLERRPKFVPDLNICAAQQDSESISLLFESEYKDYMLLPSSDAANISDPSELCPGIGLTQSAVCKSPLHEHERQNGLCPVASIMGKRDSLDPSKDSEGSSSQRVAYREVALALWPRLSTTTSHNNEVHDPSMRSLSTEAAAWLNSTSGSRHGSSESSFVNEKIQPFTVDRRQLPKRCATHVYISYLIQAYRNTQKTPGWLVSPNQLKPTERTHAGIGVVGDANGSTVRRPTEMRVHQDHRWTSETSGSCTSLKQNCDFLSLSTWGRGLESITTNASSNQVGNGLETSKRVNFPHLQSTDQHQVVMSGSLSQAWHSSPYPELLKTAKKVQLQRRQNQGGSLYSQPHIGHPGSTKQQQQRPPQIWEAQVVSKYLSEGTLSNFPKGTNGRHDSPSIVPSAFPILPPPSFEMMNQGGKFLHGTQQLYQFAVASSQSSSQLHNADECGGGFRLSPASHLQFLCNADHL